jgi:hypothetical protein
MTRKKQTKRSGFARRRPLERRAMITGESPPVAEETQTVTQEPSAAADQAFADKLARRPPPNPVECTEIEKARKRTKPARHGLQR